MTSWLPRLPQRQHNRSQGAGDSKMTHHFNPRFCVAKVVPVDDGDLQLEITLTPKRGSGGFGARPSFFFRMTPEDVRTMMMNSDVALEAAAKAKNNKRTAEEVRREVDEIFGKLSRPGSLISGPGSR